MKFYVVSRICHLLVARGAWSFGFCLIFLSYLDLLSNGAGSEECVHLAGAGGEGQDGGAEVHGQEAVQNWTYCKFCGFSLFNSKEICFYFFINKWVIS